MQALFLTTIAMIAFAANSVLGRLALSEGEAGAGSFALIRLISGALMLALIVTTQNKRFSGSWLGGVMLFGYAALFSYAYLALDAGMGALILFATVQITMIGVGVSQGERLSAAQTVGASLALVSLVWFISPGLSAPPLLGAAAMGISGLCWAIYSLAGKKHIDPTAATAGNFLRAAALAILLLPLALMVHPEPEPSLNGLWLAILSGAVTSGLGYVVWYAALKPLTAIRAGLAQLTVPIFTALGGVLFLSEPLTVRFILASAAILGGVALATLAKTPR